MIWNWIKSFFYFERHSPTQVATPPKDESIFHGCAGQKVIDRYGDFKEIGLWGSVNVKTGEYTPGGKMYSETVKFKDEDGNTRLGSDWVAGDKEEEK